MLLQIYYLVFSNACVPWQSQIQANILRFPVQSACLCLYIYFNKQQLSSVLRNVLFLLQ